MKKFTYMAAIIAAAFSLSSCNMGGSQRATSNNTGASAGAALGSILGSTLGGATGSTAGQAGGGILGSLLSTLLGNATTNKQTIIGTWTYKAPEVRFESENVLSQIGGTVVSSKIQSALGSQLKKIGLQEGKSTFTFNQDGSLVVTMGNKKTTGKYTYNSSNHTITMTGALGLTNTTCTVAVTGNVLYLLFDSSKLLNMATQLSSVSSTLSSLLGNYNGLKLGWSMTK